MILSALLAHQGGWDEILFVLAPLVLFAVLLVLARRRVDQLDATEQSDDDPEAPPTEPDRSQHR